MLGEHILKVVEDYGLVISFVYIGAIMWLSYWISSHLTKGRIPGSAIAMILGFVIAYIGGVITGGSKGIADITIFGGVGTLGGAMFRDYAIISTAFGARLCEVKKAGLVGIFSIVIGVISAYIVGALIALAFGYTDTASITTIGAGTVTFIVGPVTGAAVGASSEVIAISIASGVVKSLVVMIVTPIMAPHIGLNTPRAAIIYGGLMGTTSGTAAGLAATDPALVPYGAMTSTFYTGLGCVICPSLLYLLTKLIFG